MNTQVKSTHDKLGQQELIPNGPRAIQKIQRRKELIAASRKVLSEGYADFSMRKVAALAKVRLNTLQYHFGDGQQLIEITVRSTIEEYIYAYRQFGSVEYEYPIEKLIALLDLGLIGIRNTTLRRFFLEAWTMGLHNPAILNLLRTGYEDYVQVVRDIIVNINPHLTTSDLEVLSSLIVAWGEGIMVLSEWGGDETPSIAAMGEKMKETCIDMITKGMPEMPTGIGNSTGSKERRV